MHTVSNQIVDIWKAWEWDPLAMHVVSIEKYPTGKYYLTGVEVVFQTHTRSTISIYLHLIAISLYNYFFPFILFLYP